MRPRRSRDLPVGMGRPSDTAFFPGRAPVEAYGNGGFRFAGMSHRGSILMLPSGVYAWEVADMSEATAERFWRVFEAHEDVGFVLFGTGDAQCWPSQELERCFLLRRVGLECMATGAAVRTYNVLLAEGRPVAAALIAVETPRPADG